MIEYSQPTITYPVSETADCWPVKPFRRRHEVGQKELANDGTEEQVWTRVSDTPLSSQTGLVAREFDLLSLLYEQAAVQIEGELSGRFSVYFLKLDVQLEESSTSWFELDVLNKSKRIQAEISALFAKAQSIRIESGMENDLSVGIRDIIKNHGSIALGHIESIILQNKVPVSLAREILKYIGSFEMSNWHGHRRFMLENCLRESQYAWIRDGAGLGISFLDDPRSISVVKTAIAKERNEELKEDLIQVLEQLEETLLESS